MGRFIERGKAQEELRCGPDVNTVLSDLYEPLISPAATIEDIAVAVQEKAKSLTRSEHGYVSAIDPATGFITQNLADTPI